LALARFEDAWPEPRFETAAPRGAPVLAFTLVLIVAAVAPALYGFVAFHGQWVRMTQPAVIRHVAFNWLANGVVVLGAARLTGRFDRKLAKVFSRTFLAHGAVAFLTLVFRHYYSIPMMLAGVVCSGVLGVGTMYARHAQGRERVGVLGPVNPAILASVIDWERIDDPDASLRRFDWLLITFAGDVPRTWSPLVCRALVAGKRVRHLSEYLEEAEGVVAAEHFSLDHLPKGGAASWRAGKRVIDVVLVIATLPLTLPVLGLAVAAARATMGRPTFFVQSRVGQGGRVFDMFKLRTMRPPREAERGVATLEGDTRITPLGRWLRRFHIDELPQLLNVLIGDMSLVGPRPEQPGLAETYARKAPAFTYRQLVRPGITGWAQVRAGYAADLAETRVKLGFDLYYLKNFSVALDAQILLRTVGTLVSGGGVR